MHKTDDCMQVVQFPVFHIVIHSHVQTVLREYKVMSGYGGSVYLSNSQSEGQGKKEWYCNYK